MIPLVEDRAGAWYPAKYKSGSNLRGVYGYKVFVAIALFLGDGLYNLVKIIILSVRNMLAQRRAKKSGLPVTAKAASESILLTLIDTHYTIVTLGMDVLVFIGSCVYIYVPCSCFIYLSQVDLPNKRSLCSLN